MNIVVKVPSLIYLNMTLLILNTDSKERCDNYFVLQQIASAKTFFIAILR